MYKKLLIAAVFAVAPFALMESSSADYCYGYGSGYRAYRAPVVSYRSAYPGFYQQRGYLRSYPSPVYRSGYRGVGPGVGVGFGRYPAYRHPYGYGRSGFSLRIGF